MVTLELLYLKIVDGSEVIPKESCISEEEYELMFQCCERELSSRPKVTDIKRRLTKLLKEAEGIFKKIIVADNIDRGNYVMTAAISCHRNKNIEQRYIWL